MRTIRPPRSCPAAPWPRGRPETRGYPPEEEERRGGASRGVRAPGACRRRNSCEDFRAGLPVRRHRDANPAGELLGDFREVRDQDDLLEELAHPKEFLDEQLPRHLAVQGPEVAFVDEQGLNAAERPADLWHRGELPRDREPQRRVDLGLLAPAELRHVVPLTIDALHEDPHSVAASLLVRLQADPAEPVVGQLREIL